MLLDYKNESRSDTVSRQNNNESRDLDVKNTFTKLGMQAACLHMYVPWPLLLLPPVLYVIYDCFFYGIQKVQYNT